MPDSNAPVVLLITVTDEEYRAVLKALHDDYQRVLPNPPPLIKGRYVDLGMLGSARVYLTQSRMGAAGYERMQDVTTQGIADLTPDAVINLGIAFGVNDTKQQIGDILVSEKLISYGKIRIDPGLGNKPHYTVDGDQHAAPLFRPFSMLAQHWQEAPSNLRVRTGALLTGPVLVNDQEFRDVLVALAPKIIGGDMEGEGLYAAAASAPYKVGWILVKGISDFAANKNTPSKDADQALAAFNAARFVLYVIVANGITTSIADPTAVVDDKPTHSTPQVQEATRPTINQPSANVSQTINNQAPNQGAQGVFQGPLTFNIGAPPEGSSGSQPSSGSSDRNQTHEE